MRTAAVCVNAVVLTPPAARCRARAGVAVFKQSLTQVTTIYKDKSGKSEEKVRHTQAPGLGPRLGGERAQKLGAAGPCRLTRC